jgi:hypothetical protein
MPPLLSTSNLLAAATCLAAVLLYFLQMPLQAQQHMQHTKLEHNANSLLLTTKLPSQNNT